MTRWAVWPLPIDYPVQLLDWQSPGETLPVPRFRTLMMYHRLEHCVSVRSAGQALIRGYWHPLCDAAGGGSEHVHEALSAFREFVDVAQRD